MSEFTLEEAICFAATAHEHQTDKSDEPYILHALRVMLSVPADLRIPGLLHDVVEDTIFGFEHLREVGVSESDIELIDLLTHRVRETREDYIARIMTNPDAIVIKRADMKDNLSRVGKLDEATRNRLEEKYRRDIIQLNTPWETRDPART